jgi:hypothetical protein
LIMASRALSTFAKTVALVVTTPRLLLNRDPVRYYEYLGDDVVEGEKTHFKDAGRPLWLNLGYWKHANTYPEAAAALACLLADHAELKRDDALLDVGFGFAEQDFLWLERYGVKHISGVNITPIRSPPSNAPITSRPARLSLLRPCVCCARAGGWP